MSVAMAEPITKPLRDAAADTQHPSMLSEHLSALFPEIADALDAADALPLAAGESKERVRLSLALSNLRAAIERECGDD